jgi:hypothetical protein
MTKQEIINLVCENELLHHVNSIRAITLGTVAFVEAVGNEIKDREHSFMPIIQAFNTANGDLMIHIPKISNVTAKPVKQASRPDPTEIVRSRSGWVVPASGKWYARKVVAHRENSRLQSSAAPDIIKFEY